MKLTKKIKKTPWWKAKDKQTKTKTKTKEEKKQ